MSAGNIIDPHDSLNVPMIRYVFGMRHANLFVKKQIWKYNRRIFPEMLALYLFDLLTVIFQGQTFFDSS